MHLRNLSLTALMLTLLASGCVPETESGVDAPVLSVTVEVETPTLEPTDVITEEVEFAPSEQPTAEATEPAEPTPTVTLNTAPGDSPGSPPVDLPPGLMISENASQGRLWQLQASGEMEEIGHAIVNFALSPDGTQMLYETGGSSDIWLWNLVSGEIKKVTNTPTRQERSPRWWPGHDGFVCASAGLHGTFLLTYVGFDGTYEILDPDTPLWADVEPSPDGSAIAYQKCCMQENGEASTLRLYHADGTIEQVNMRDYGIDAGVTSGIGWSPDGSQLAVVTLRSGENNTSLSDIALLNLADHTSRILATNPPLGGDAALTASIPVWFPSGDWMAFFLQPDDWSSYGIYAADAEQVWRISPETPDDRSNLWYGQPAISPDGEWIAVQTHEGIGLIRTSDWSTYEWSLEVYIAMVRWAELR